MPRLDTENLAKAYGKRKRLTRAGAIRAFCVECMGYQWQYIATCPDGACPLWPYRSGGSEEPTDITLRTAKKG